jgi:hypothetical protein
MRETPVGEPALSDYRRRKDLMLVTAPESDEGVRYGSWESGDRKTDAARGRSCRRGYGVGLGQHRWAG